MIMAKSRKVSIDKLIEDLQKQKAKGETEITLHGYIADSKNNYNIVISDMEAFTEQSYADETIDRMFRF